MTGNLPSEKAWRRDEKGGIVCFGEEGSAQLQYNVLYSGEVTKTVLRQVGFGKLSKLRCMR